MAGSGSPAVCLPPRKKRRAEGPASERNRETPLPGGTHLAEGRRHPRADCAAITLAILRYVVQQLAGATLRARTMTAQIADTATGNRGHRTLLLSSPIAVASRVSPRRARRVTKASRRHPSGLAGLHVQRARRKTLKPPAFPSWRWR